MEVALLLLDHKPNVNALDKDGCTALAIACREGHHEIASALLNAGAYVNIQDRTGDTNLIHAVKGGHRSVVESLLKKYADVDIAGKVRLDFTLLFNPRIFHEDRFERRHYVFHRVLRFPNIDYSNKVGSLLASSSTQFYTNGIYKAS